jgi:outer membrane lipopolysaccharide assembly protein LptE/RlpB
MAQISETRNSKFETRNPDAFLLYTQKRNSMFVACSAGTAPRTSGFEFRVSIRTACRLLLTACCLLFFPACGYHVAGTASRIPPNVKTIAVPAFKNTSTTFRIEQQLTSAVTREFLERTHYRILPNPADADAVLEGTVKDVRARAITFDVNTGIATSLQVQVTADVKLEDRHSHKLLFANSNFVFREEYQVSETPAALFEEDRPALDRLSRDLARTLVTDILENF